MPKPIFKWARTARLTLGARYTDEEKTVDFQGTVNSAGMVAAGIPLEQSEQEITPRIAYAHKFSEDMMMYASATNGFKSGGWNARGIELSLHCRLLHQRPFGLMSWVCALTGWMDDSEPTSRRSILILRICKLPLRRQTGSSSQLMPVA